MFGRKRRTEKLAADLIAVFAESKPLVEYANMLEATDAERERLMFSALLSPLVASYFFAVAQKYGYLADIVSESHQIILAGL